MSLDPVTQAYYVLLEPFRIQFATESVRPEVGEQKGTTSKQTKT